MGVYRGAQLDTTYARLDDGTHPEHAKLRMSTQQTFQSGEFYTLLPPDGDIHYVKTVSQQASVSIHLLANDTACVWRHKFDPEAGTVTAFRSGYSNVKCKPTDPPYPCANLLATVTIRQHATHRNVAGRVGAASLRSTLTTLRWWQ